MSDYDFLDVTSDIYPFFGSYDYIHNVKSLLLSGNYGIVAAQDGYLLLKRGIPAPGISPYSASTPDQMDPAYVLPDIPETFCTYVNVSPAQVKHPIDATFTETDDSGASMDLVGFSVNAPSTFSKSSGYMTVETYWKVNVAIKTPVQPIVLITANNEDEYLAPTEFPTTEWCQTNMWKPGMIMRLTSRVFSLQNTAIPIGLAHVDIALVPLTQPASKIMDVQYRLPLHMTSTSSIATVIDTKNVVQLQPLIMIP